MYQKHSFTAFGTNCDVTIQGGDFDRLSLFAVNRAQELFRMWSLNRADSELSLLNERRFARDLSRDTFQLIDYAVEAWESTHGLFNPTVLDLQAGFDRSLTHLTRDGIRSLEDSHGEHSGPRAVPRAPGCAEIELVPSTRSVRLPSGIRIDPSGIMRGLAADLIADDLIAAGADGVCVSIGGEIRVTGEAPSGGWRIGIANPVMPGEFVTVVTLHNQGLASGDKTIRRWAHGESQNALISADENLTVTGRMAVSVIASSTWWAEALAHVAMSNRGMSDPIITALGGEALFVSVDSTVRATGGFSQFDTNHDRDAAGSYRASA